MSPGTEGSGATFVNLLKEFPIGDPTRSSQHGEVTEEVDRTIGRRVWRIYGLVSANNFVCFPSTRNAQQKLEIRANYVYVQFKPMANRFFVMHFDLSTPKNSSLRISLTNLVKEPKVRARVIQYPLVPPSRWVQLCIHLPSIIGQFTKLPPMGNTLVSVQVCACLYLRGLFVSDHLYTTNDIPKPLRLKEVSGLMPQDLLPWVYIPIGCRSSECNQISCSSTDPSTPEPLPDGDQLESILASAASLPEIPWSGGEQAEVKSLNESPCDSRRSQLFTGGRRPAEDVFGVRAVLQAEQVSGLCRPAQLRKCGAVWVGDSKIFSCHSSILLYRNLRKNTSRCLLGHSAIIEFLEVAHEARLAATVENAAQQPSIRIWKLPPVESDSEDIRCTAILQSATLERISLLRLDPRGRYMVLVGSDRLNRQQLQVWELYGLLTTGRPNLLARQVSDFQVETLRISPLEELRLVSCGKENIRFWRIKNGHLPGSNVTLDGLGRGNLFTDLAFILPDQAVGPNTSGLSSLAKLLVSSTCGSLLEIDYFTRAVRRVFTLHQNSIWALSTGPGFCVTASADKTILCTCGDSAVELLNLTTQQHLQVSRAHPARVLHASASVALRELYTVCEDGLVRVWTLPQLSQTFEMESPQDPPLCVAAHPTQRVLALGFKSGAVRVLAVEGPAVWMEANHHTHPITGVWFVNSPAIATDLEESCAGHVAPHEFHHQPSSTGHRELLLKARKEIPGQGVLVISLDGSGCICIFSQLHEFALIRKLESPQIEKAPEGVPPLVFSGDGSKAVRYFSPRTLGLLRLPKFSYEAEVCPFQTACKSVIITTYSFSASGDALCVCGSDSRMRVFSFKNEGDATSLIQSREIALLSGSISVAWISASSEESGISSVGVTCGEDSLIKVWNLSKPSATQGNEEVTRKESNERREVEDPEAVSNTYVNHNDCCGSPAHHCTKAFAAAGHTAEFPQFQSFAGHNRPPFMVQLFGDYLVSVSATETITWRVGSPLLRDASDITPAGSIALLPAVQECSPASDPASVDDHFVQQQQESLHKTSCEQGKLPQPQQPPRAHPQPLKQHVLSSRRALQTTDGLKAISRSSNDASLPHVPSFSFPLHPSLVPGQTNSFPIAVATSVRAADSAPASQADAKTQGCTGVSNSSPLAQAPEQQMNGGGIAVPAVYPQEDGCDANSTTTAVDTISTNVVQSQSKPSGTEVEVSKTAGHVPNVKVFAGFVGAAIQLETSICNGQRVSVSQGPQEPNGRWGPRAEGAAARHVVGTAVASCRSSCLWRPLKGVLAHAVGSWVLVERLSTPAALQDGKCLGLLPALLGRPQQLRGQQQPITADSPKRKSLALQRQQRRAQLLQQCATVAQAPRISVLRHPVVGHAIAFAIDTTTRLAATISILRFPESFTAHARCICTNDCRHSCGSCCGSTTAAHTGEWGVPTPSCLALCLWRAEGGGELLGAVRLPLAYGEADNLRLNGRKATLGGPDRDVEDLPGVLFCGSDLVVTAGGADSGRLDVWRVSDFLPRSKYLGNSQSNDEELVEASQTGAAAATGNLCWPECSSSCTSCCCCSKKNELSVFGRLVQFSSPAVGAEVGTPLRKLLTAASNDEREVVFEERLDQKACSFSFSTPNRPNGCWLTLLKITQPHASRVEPRGAPAYCWWHLTAAGCMPTTTRQMCLSSSSSLATFLLECTYTATEPARVIQLCSVFIYSTGSITCGKAMYLTYSTGSLTRRATVDLIRVLEMQQGLGPQSVDLRQQAALQPLALDAPIKSLQLDAEAQEGIATTATNTIWYIHWDQRAKVRLHSSHSRCITQLAVSYHQVAASGTVTGAPKSSRLQHLLRNAEAKGVGDLPLIATADSAGSLRLWSRWPLPQQMADFSLPHPCTALAFLWRSLLLGCFRDGSLRLFDTNAFRIVGRLQLATTDDPPVAIACLGDRHALLATASGELLSLILDLRFKDKADPASPEIKHASVSKIANALTACFGPTFSLQKPPSAPWSNSCNTRGSNCGSAALGTSAAEKIITAVDCLVGQRQATGPPAGDNRIRFALCLSGGYCSVGAYSQVAPENKWMLCSKSCFGIRFGPDKGDAEPSCRHHLEASRACFSGRSTLLIGRGVYVYLVDCEAQKVTRRINVREADGVFNSLALGRMSVAAICALRDDTTVVVTEGGEALLLQLIAGSMATVGQSGIHPNLPRAFEGPTDDPICLAAYGEDEVVIACGCSLSMVHVF